GHSWLPSGLHFVPSAETMCFPRSSHSAGVSRSSGGLFFASAARFAALRWSHTSARQVEHPSGTRSHSQGGQTIPASTGLATSANEDTRRRDSAANQVADGGAALAIVCAAT